MTKTPDISTKINLILQATGWSQRDFAGRLDVPPKTLNSWIVGSASPRPGNLELIEQAYLDLVGRSAISTTELDSVEARALSFSLDAATIFHHPTLYDTLRLYTVYSSNTLAGSSLNLENTSNLIHDASLSIEAPFSDLALARNHGLVIHHVLSLLYSQGHNFTWNSELICDLHFRLLYGIKDSAGKYRDSSNAFFSLSTNTNLPLVMQEFTNQINTPDQSPLLHLAKLYAQFSHLRPFHHYNRLLARVLVFTEALRYHIVPPLFLPEQKFVHDKYLAITRTHEDYSLLRLMIAEDILAMQDLIKNHE